MDRNQPPVQLVITASEPYGAELASRTRCRMTLGVLTQLLAESKSKIVIAAPFLQPGYGVSGGPLADALRAALKRGVDVDVVSTARGLRTLDVARLRRQVKGHLRLFRPQANLVDEQRLGSHAKFCIADGQKAYIGSANLTGPGLTGHLEMGVLVHGEVAQQIGQFWTYSIQVGIFVSYDSLE